MIFGLFKGWCAFNDGRQHALVDEAQWRQAMMEAGFGRADWSCGKTPEAETVRLLAGLVDGDE